MSELCSSSETEANLETELFAPIELNTMKVQINKTNFMHITTSRQEKYKRERKNPQIDVLVLTNMMND